ncbi:MAG TPA: sulfate ABC transporter permease subunit CysT, partial [Alcanivorax sp.]|nr:sulfate ABC transporter permease subunit CysT [Alcanivorax sp.]
VPFALPTAVAGLTLSALFAANGWLGQWFEAIGIPVAYTPLGIMIAMSFTSLPFVVRAVQPVLEDLTPDVEEAAATLGATPMASFFRVVLAQLMPALLTGTALAFTRSLGEYGAVIFIAGNMPFETEIISLLVNIRLEEYDFAAASALASVILAASLVLLFGIQVVQGRLIKRWQGN